jgi:hypothetical protein
MVVRQVAFVVAIHPPIFVEVIIPDPALHMVDIISFSHMFPAKETEICLIIY